MGKTLIMENLGLYGWENYEPVILAALASEEPLLLVGRHGSAKSQLLESLSKEMGLEFRNYNASLVDYDDLVGIPFPVNNNTSLSYISNLSSIWGAEVVFVDEINRVKPDLQNKLFPIIYEKRVQGEDLRKLRYRWAAMNPPSGEDDEVDYLGASPLDPALADRFPFVLKAPTYEDLSSESRRALLLAGLSAKRGGEVDLPSLVEETKANMEELRPVFMIRIARYTECLMDGLKARFGYFSARRAVMMEKTLLGILASLKTLKGRGADVMDDFRTAACLHIESCLPNRALEGEIDEDELLALAIRALKASSGDEDSVEIAFLKLKGAKEKVLFLKDKSPLLDPLFLDQTITETVGGVHDEASRGIYSYALYCLLKDDGRISASTMETLALQFSKIVDPGKSLRLAKGEKEALERYSAPFARRCKEWGVPRSVSEAFYKLLRGLVASQVAASYLQEADDLFEEVFLKA